MNKENLAAELVCLLDVASLPPDVAPLKAKIESFFIAGSARIDLIAKVMDLDNDMGGYLFDIPVLNDTRDAIVELGKSAGMKRSSLITAVRQVVFFSYLLWCSRSVLLMKERWFQFETPPLHPPSVKRQLLCPFKSVSRTVYVRFSAF